MFQLRPAGGPTVGPDGAPGAGADGGSGDGDGGGDGGPDKLEDLLNVDTLQIEMGYGLLALADPKKGGDVLERVTSVRRNFVQDMGFHYPGGALA